jgi:nucleoside-diphosphate-sugar epimerase
MRIVIIGGTGHIGSYLVPRLVHLGHQVMVVTRGKRQPYRRDAAWNEVEQVLIDRESSEADGHFGQAICELKPDVVMDLVCFTLASATQLVEALQGQVQLFAHCGTVWVRGYSAEVPATEEMPRNPPTPYGVQKNQIEAYLLDQARRFDFPATVLHPGHISGPGWLPVGPTACHDPAAISRCIRGEEIVLPNLGLETVHHVHADDVAQGFEKTLSHWNQAVGESFFIVSPAALTLRGLAEGLAARFGQKAQLRFEPFEAWKDTIPLGLREGAISHVIHSTNCSIAKAQHLLGYQPRYHSLDVVEEAVHWLVADGQVLA